MKRARESLSRSARNYPVCLDRPPLGFRSSALRKRWRREENRKGTGSLFQTSRAGRTNCFDTFRRSLLNGHW